MVKPHREASMATTPHSDKASTVKWGRIGIDAKQRLRYRNVDVSTFWGLRLGRASGEGFERGGSRREAPYLREAPTLFGGGLTLFGGGTDVF